jgi:glycosyltransferase involved in cell wall biosynthesis
MRVLQIVTAFGPGGIQRHVLGLSASLRERGHYVFLAGTRGTWLNESLDAAFLPLDLDGVAKEGGALARRLRNAVKAALRLRPFLRRERIELIHAHESAPALVAAIATIGMSTPTLVSYHGSEPERVAAFGRIARLAARCVIAPLSCAASAACPRQDSGSSAWASKPHRPSTPWRYSGCVASFSGTKAGAWW